MAWLPQAVQRLERPQVSRTGRGVWDRPPRTSSCGVPESLTRRKFREKESPRLCRQNRRMVPSWKECSIPSASAFNCPWRSRCSLPARRMSRWYGRFSDRRPGNPGPSPYSYLLARAGRRAVLHRGAEPGQRGAGILLALPVEPLLMGAEVRNTGLDFPLKIARNYRPWG